MSQVENEWNFCEEGKENFVWKVIQSYQHKISESLNLLQNLSLVNAVVVHAVLNWIEKLRLLTIFYIERVKIEFVMIYIYEIWATFCLSYYWKFNISYIIVYL